MRRNALILCHANRQCSPLLTLKQRPCGQAGACRPARTRSGWFSNLGTSRINALFRPPARTSRALVPKVRQSVRLGSVRRASPRVLAISAQASGRVAQPETGKAHDGQPLSEILLYSCIAAFVTGIVIAAASLISYMAAISGAWLRRKVHQPWDG